MVIELSGVQFGLKSSEIVRVIWIHKYDFRPKLYDTKFNYHLIIFILKSLANKQNKMTEIFPFVSRLEKHLNGFLLALRVQNL